MVTVVISTVGTVAVVNVVVVAVTVAVCPGKEVVDVAVSVALAVAVAVTVPTVAVLVTVDTPRKVVQNALARRAETMDRAGLLLLQDFQITILHCSWCWGGRNRRSEKEGDGEAHSANVSLSRV